jgi:hypothetical protein
MRAHARLTIFFLTAAAIGLAACRPNETVEGQAKDAKIKAQIKARLAKDVDAATLTSVSVNVTNGVVTLAGPVHSADESSRIESSARAVEGVTQVNNSLQVLGGAPTVVSVTVPTAAMPVFTPIPGATPALPGATPTP